MVVNVVVAGQMNTERYQRLAAELGASFAVLGGSSVAQAIIEAAQQAHVGHVFIGESKQTGFWSRWKKSLADELTDALPSVDVHVIAHHHQEDKTAEDQRLSPEALMRRERESARGRHAGVRVYLGYADGCGTTTAMLDEARRRKSRGTDVVVGAVRTSSAEALASLELLGGPQVPAATDRLDVDAMMARNPEVACIDELNGLDTGGRLRAESIPRLLQAGITVLGTVHLLDLASVRDSYARLLKDRTPGAVLSDDVLAQIDELEIVDATPALLLERLRRGEIMPPAEAARALQAEFRPQVLSALREMAFRVIAEHTDRRLVAYMRERKIEAPWEARTRVVACIPPRPGMERRIEQVALHAARHDAQFVVVSVRPPKLSESERRWLGEYATLVHQKGGEFVSLYGSNIAATIADYVRSTLTTELVLGRRRKRWRPWDTTSTLVRLVSDVDVHILRRDQTATTQPLAA
jgi:two-component system sensor histidine kinase KdpD